jgi:SnoaL-like domain
MDETNEWQVPNLEEMDERQAHRFLTELYADLSPEKEYELRHEDYVMEMPQSGERIRGREKMRELQESFLDDSNPPTIRVRRVLVRDGLWVGEGIIDYGNGTVLDSVGVVELKDGKIWRDTRYFAEPFEAPAWRAHLVERMEP